LSVLLLAVLSYWALVIVGAFDIEMFDFDGDPDTGGGAGGWWGSLGLVGVPATIDVSIAIPAAWVFVITVQQFIPVGGAVGLLLGTGALVVGWVVGVLVARVAIRPLRPLFKVQSATRHGVLIGKVCEVTTMRVDASFGQARFQDGADDLMLQVRCETVNTLARGSRALLVSNAADTGAFTVIPYDDAAECVVLQLTRPE
jgi:hypothetical protein